VADQPLEGVAGFELREGTAGVGGKGEHDALLLVESFNRDDRNG
jgi:hypothetical protein